MFTKEFWNERAQKYGHTGYADAYYYCFDQQARLYAIKQLVARCKQKKRALDFGCGSGDFVKLLSSCFNQTYGYDISEVVINKANGRFKNSNIVLWSDTTQLEPIPTYDLILTVTVLQSLNKNELAETLALFSKLLNSEAQIISMEFFSTEEHNLKTNENRITERDWLLALSQNQLKVVSATNFYSPVEYPSASWLQYKDSLFLKFVRLFKHYSWAEYYLSRISKKLIARYDDVTNVKNSRYKIYVIERLTP
jgi:cyclopropane fatty-acyl-phospholipid synthase-like methyltransferase